MKITSGSSTGGVSPHLLRSKDHRNGMLIFQDLERKGGFSPTLGKMLESEQAS